MTAERDFIDAILANPADDTARLVYADWLQEQGEEARAEFIRAQIAWARTGEESFRQRAAELLEANNLLWYGPGLEEIVWDEIGRSIVEGDGLRLPKWERGFVVELTCSAEDWHQFADTILSRHPVRSVELTTRPKFADFHREWVPDLNPDGTPAGRKQLCRATVAGRLVTLKPLAESEDPAPEFLKARWPHIAFRMPALPTGASG